MPGTDASDPGETEPVADGAPRSPRGRPPSALLMVLGGIALESAAMLIFAGAVVVELVRGGSTNIGVSAFVVVFFLGLAWLLAGCGRGLWRGSRRGRSPVAGWQIFQGLIGIALLAGGSPAAVVGGVVALVLAAVVLLGLMMRGVVEHTAD